MIDLSVPNEWQHICPDTGLVMPWYTKPALDEIVTWDMKDKVVFEYGCGASSLWWAAKCKKVCGVDWHMDYCKAVWSRIEKVWRDVAPVFIGHADNEQEYINRIRQYELFDIIIIDGSFRDACVPVALECLKPGGKLIFDNWMQPEVEMQTEETQAIVLALPHQVYKQPGHPHWQTLIATKP